MNNKKSLIFNLLIVVLEIIGLIVTLFYNNRISYEYYTEDSNILALFSSLLFVIFLLKGKIPKWVQLFKYMTTICLTVTFLVVIFILAPMYNFAYNYLLFHNSLLYQHLLCPILSIITFLFFDDIDVLGVRENFFGIFLTILYAVILIVLNIMELVVGPYPFLMVRNQSLFMSIVWFVLIIGLAYLIAFILRKLYVKIRNKDFSERKI